MGAGLATITAPLILKTSSPTILAPPARAIAETFPSISLVLAAPVAAATGSAPRPAFTQRTLYPPAATATASASTPGFSIRTIYPPAVSATAAGLSPLPLLRVISPPAIATAASTAPSREELSAPPALASVTGLRSTFKGPDEDPISEGGLWGTLSTSIAHLKKSGQVMKSTTGTNVLHARVFDGVGAAMTDQEVFVKLAKIPASNARDVRLLARVTQDGGANTHDGYMLYLPGPAVGFTTSSLTLYRTTNNGFTAVLATLTGVPVADGMWLKLVCRGTRIEGWTRYADGNDWTLRLAATDATYASGKPGILLLGDTNSPHVSRFGATAGTYPLVSISVDAPARNATAAAPAPTLFKADNEKRVVSPVGASTAASGAPLPTLLVVSPVGASTARASGIPGITMVVPPRDATASRVPPLIEKS